MPYDCKSFAFLNKKIAHIVAFDNRKKRVRNVLSTQMLTKTHSTYKFHIFNLILFFAIRTFVIFV